MFLLCVEKPELQICAFQFRIIVNQARQDSLRLSIVAQACETGGAHQTGARISRIDSQPHVRISLGVRELLFPKVQVGQSIQGWNIGVVDPNNSQVLRFGRFLGSF